LHARDATPARAYLWFRLAEVGEAIDRFQFVGLSGFSMSLPVQGEAPMTANPWLREQFQAYGHDSSSAAQHLVRLWVSNIAWQIMERSIFIQPGTSMEFLNCDDLSIPNDADAASQF
jgi:hypothetical protein